MCVAAIKPAQTVLFRCIGSQGGNGMRKLLGYSAVAWVMLANCSSLHAAIWRIEPSGGGDAPTIQAGIDSSAAGDTILLADGTFTGVGNREIYFLGKAVVVTSDNGPDMAMIDCEGLGIAFLFQDGEGSTSILSGITIQNSYSYLEDYPEENPWKVTMAAISCYEASPTIENNRFINSQGYEGGCIYLYRGSAIIRGNLFQDSWSITGGAIQSYYSDFTATDNDFINNSSGDGGAIEFWGGPVTISSNRFYDNSAQIWGGAIAIYYGTGNITDNTFENNVCMDVGGGGIYCKGSVSIRSNVFRNNIGSFGGAIRVDFDPASIEDNTFIGNTAAEGGGGIFQWNCSPVISGNLLIGNAAGMAGGGIYCWGGAPVISHNTLSGNSCPAVTDPTMSQGGGGIFCRETSAVISNTIIAFSVQGAGLAYSQEYPSPVSHTVASCDIFGNAGGDALWAIDGGGNISEDPLFCDPIDEDYRLSSLSPCLLGMSGRIGAFGLGCALEEPVISVIEDVRNDQGRQVNIAWYRSAHDTADSATPVLGYEIYRKIDDLPFGDIDHVPGFLLNEKEKDKGSPASLYSPGDWHCLMTVPANGDDVYSAAVPTLEDSCVYNDSTAAGEPLYYSTFFIRAATLDPTMYFDSAVDSGYSVDNISPHIPECLAGYQISEGLLIVWCPDSSEGFCHYALYCGSSQDFIPGPENLRTTTTDTFFVDSNWHYPGTGFYYKLSAFDKNGNESGYALLIPEVVVATLLQSFHAAFIENLMAISWELSQIDEGVAFLISRQDGPGEVYKEISDARIIREGLSFSFIDRNCDPGATCRYRVEISNEAGRHILFETGAIFVPVLPLALYQNYPNPFNPSTTIIYYLPENCPVRLEIFNVCGKRVATLVNESREKGRHVTEWNGQDQNGCPVSSGTYFYRLKAGKETISRKMVLLR